MAAIRRNRAVDASRAKTALLLPRIVRVQAIASVADPVTAGSQCLTELAPKWLTGSRVSGPVKSPGIGRE